MRGGQRVVDLGAAPGAWSQYVQRHFAARAAAGTIVALDILPMEPIEGVVFIQGDFHDEQVAQRLRSRARRRAGRPGALRHGAQPLGHRQFRRGAHRATWSNWPSISRCST